MIRIVRNSSLVLFALGAMLLSACRIPLSEHPLSDEASSKIDERLIGTWELDLSAINPKIGKKADEKNTAAYRVERVEGKPNSLISRIWADGKAGDEAYFVHTTHLAMHDFLTWGAIQSEEAKPFAICLYELTDADHGKLYVMNDAFLIDLIERGKTPGKTDRDGGGNVAGIMLTGDQKQLRKLLQRHGVDCFDMENPIICRRVKAEDAH